MTENVRVNTCLEERVLKEIEVSISEGIKELQELMDKLSGKPVSDLARRDVLILAHKLVFFDELEIAIQREINYWDGLEELPNLVNAVNVPEACYSHYLTVDVDMSDYMEDLLNFMNQCLA